jgi:glycosyltransferase involved in cell wall biosynthesis
MSVSRLSEKMVSADYETEVFTTTANGNEELAVAPGEKKIVDGVPITYFKRITRDHSHFSPTLLRTLWKEAKKFDIIHIHAWWNLVSVLSCWIAIRRKIPVVISPRGTLSAYSFTNRNNLSKKMIHGLLGKRLLNQSYIHVTSDREEAGIASLIHPKRIINIPNFIVIPEHIYTGKRDETGPMKLLFFSRIEEKKGLDVLLNSLKNVSTPYHLTIAGDGDPEYIEKLQKISEANNLSEKISWIGFQGANKFDVLYQHDLMILPSHDENFGNVVIESLSVGTAVLVSKYVGLAHYVTSTELGWVCDLDANDIARQIDNIANEAGRLKQIRTHSPLKVRRDFAEENLIKKYIEMYNQIINNG